jgi:hypothetical protein
MIMVLRMHCGGRGRPGSPRRDAFQEPSPVH